MLYRLKKMNSNRKANLLTDNFGSIVLIVLVVAISAWMINRYFSIGNTEFSKPVLEARIQNCKIQTDLARSRGVDISEKAGTDKDSDGYADACDICVNPKSPETNPYKDTDLDGMSNQCDEASNDPKKSGCLPSSSWNEDAKKDGRCVRG